TILADGEDASALKNGQPAAKAPKVEATEAQFKADQSASPIDAKGVASSPAAIAAPESFVAPEPDVPEGTEMVTMTVREALRDAMAEEMRRDPDVFVMGEEVAEYQGAYKVTQ